MSWVSNAFCAERYDRVLATVAPLMIVSQYVLYAACRRFIGQPKVNADALKHHVKDGRMTEAAWAQFWKDLSGQVWCCCFHIAFSCLALYGAANYVVLDDVSPERSARTRSLCFFACCLSRPLSLLLCRAWRLRRSDYCW